MLCVVFVWGPFYYISLDKFENNIINIFINSSHFNGNNAHFSCIESTIKQCKRISEHYLETQ
jgi:hypothetical protein